MRVCIKHCVNCGIEYKYQASGNYWSLKHDKSLNHDRHCPYCREIELSYLKLMSSVLDKVPKVTEIREFKTKEVDLQTLLDWEKLDNLDREELSKKAMFPLMKQCFPTLYSNDLNEWQRVSKVNGRDEFSGRSFIYSFWPSKKEEGIITTTARFDIKTNEIIGYR